MNDKEFYSWQLAPRFTSREVAALQLGLLPREATDAQIEANLRRIKHDYNLAVMANLYLINPLGDNIYNEMPEIALQSNAMIHLLDANNWSPEYNHHNLYSWLLNSCDIPGEWNRSIFEEQFFNESEIARWLKANNISSVFPFDSAITGCGAQTTSDLGRTPHRTSLMDAVNQASAKFWGLNVRADDHDTHPTNQSVAKWLIDNNHAEKTMADKIASIIRPSWAHKGKPRKD